MFYYFPVFLSITFTLKFAPVSLPWKQIQRARLEALTYSMPNGFSLRSNIFFENPIPTVSQRIRAFRLCQTSNRLAANAVAANVSLRQGARAADCGCSALCKQTVHVANQSFFA